MSEQHDQHPVPPTPGVPPVWSGEERREHVPAAPPPSPSQAPTPQQPEVVTGPLPVCDYTTDTDVACEEPVKQKRWSSVAVVVAAALGAVVGGILVGAAALWVLSSLPSVKAATSVTVKQAANSATSMTISPSTSVDRAVAVAAKAQPSVVNVSVRQAGTDPFTGQQFTQDAGNGSGVFIRPDGFILTNNHVVEGASELVVRYGNEDKVAKVIGTDPVTDLAVIKIDGTGYPAIEIGSSKDLRVGQFVVAIGSPYGLDKTVTQGIISALGRTEQAQNSNNSITTYTDLIQTDAAINPGNSGGALIDETGKLIGINALIESTTGANSGIGFAIPIDYATQIADQLMKTGKATHAYMGVSLQTLDAQTASQLGLTSTSGALIRFLETGSPADKAGLDRGDVIVNVGGREIQSTEDVFAAIRQHKIGDSVPFKVIRNGQTKTFDVVLGSDQAQ